MKKLTTIQTAVKAYSDFLTAGISYGDAMQAAAKELGDTPCITLLEELAKVHATKYGCNYTWNTAGTAVFYTGEESTRESRHGAAFQSWRRNVMVWFTPEKAKAPAKQQRISTAAKAMAMEFLGNFEGKDRAAKIKAAIALLNALK
jgi:hypothetical protein